MSYLFRSLLFDLGINTKADVEKNAQPQGWSYNLVQLFGINLATRAKSRNTSAPSDQVLPQKGNLF